MRCAGSPVLSDPSTLPRCIRSRRGSEVLVPKKFVKASDASLKAGRSGLSWISEVDNRQRHCEQDVEEGEERELFS